MRFNNHFIKSQFAFAVVPGNPPQRAVVAIEYQENHGDYFQTTYNQYFQTTYNQCLTMEECRELVHRLNSRMGIPDDVAESMLHGSMFGWDVPAAERARAFWEGE